MGYIKGCVGFTLRGDMDDLLVTNIDHLDYDLYKTVAVTGDRAQY